MRTVPSRVHNQPRLPLRVGRTQSKRSTPCRRDGGAHGLPAFSDREAADGVAGQFQFQQAASRTLPEFCIRAALDNAEEGLIVASPGVYTGLRPAGRTVHSGAEGVMGRGQAQAMIEGHDDVGPKSLLDFDRTPRTEMDGRAVQVAFHGDPVLAHGRASAQ